MSQTRLQSSSSRPFSQVATFLDLLPNRDSSRRMSLTDARSDPHDFDDQRLDPSLHPPKQGGGPHPDRQTSATATENKSASTMADTLISHSAGPYPTDGIPVNAPPHAHQHDGVDVDRPDEGVMTDIDLEFLNAQIAQSAANGIDGNEISVGLDAEEDEVALVGGVDDEAEPDRSTSAAADSSAQNWTWTCDQPGCGKRFKYESSLMDHQQIHEGINPFSCPECGKTYNDRKGLNQHVQAHRPDEERPHQCNWEGCGKGFIRRDHLARHMRTHTNERLFACKISNCGKTFVQKEALKVHMRRHTGERPYVCDLCNKAFNDPSGLHHHRGKHIEPEERSYRCDWPGCDKAYHAQYALNSHIKAHQRPKGVSSRRTSASAPGQPGVGGEGQGSRQGSVGSGGSGAGPSMSRRGTEGPSYDPSMDIPTDVNALAAAAAAVASAGDEDDLEVSGAEGGAKRRRTTAPRASLPSRGRRRGGGGGRKRGGRPSVGTPRSASPLSVSALSSAEAGGSFGAGGSRMEGGAEEGVRVEGGGRRATSEGAASGATHFINPFVDVDGGQEGVGGPTHRRASAHGSDIAARHPR